MTVPIAFDARPLTDPIDPRALAEHDRRIEAGMRAAPASTGGKVAAVAVLTIVGIVVVGVAVTLIGAFVVALATAGPLGAGATLLPALGIGGIVALIVWFVVLSMRAARRRRVRLDLFARANGMTFVPRVDSPHLPGMIFGRGGSRESLDLVRGQHPRFVEFANYQFVTGSGKSRTTHRWGYVAVRLDTPLPHIVLDAIGNNGLFGSNLPAGFDRDQRLGLEGDFDRYFSLYCPRGYERDALYLFTPDIMARFIDNAAQLDVEIVDDWLFLYSRRDLSTLDPATWAWLFSVVAALLDKLGQWGRWRDERLEQPVPVAAASALPAAADPRASAPVLTPPPGVAASGRRLKRRVPWAVLLVFGVVGLGWALLWMVGFGAFGR